MPPPAVHPEVLLATGYALLLLACAAGLEFLARHTASRSERYRTGGFTYSPEHDLWTCPENEPLWPHSVDHEHRLVRYRARASVCNACPSKRDCTSSDHGREVVRAVDPWPHSEAGRFHRGISVLLTVVAGSFVLAALVGYHRPAEAALELAALTLTGWLVWRWGRDFARTPTGFPDVDVVRGVRGDARASGAAEGQDRAPHALVDLPPPSRRRPSTSWGFDSVPRGSAYGTTRVPRPASGEGAKGENR